uniref:Uncharacterized protein n=1 Tax=Arundo donax TaxID=35708 RepID=A0A0A9HIS7_ARUDO
MDWITIHFSQKHFRYQMHHSSSRNISLPPVFDIRKDIQDDTKIEVMHQQFQSNR